MVHVAVVTVIAAKNRNVVDVICLVAVAAARRRGANSVKQVSIHQFLYRVRMRSLYRIQFAIRQHRSIRWRIVHHRCYCSSGDP